MAREKVRCCVHGDHAGQDGGNAELRRIAAINAEGMRETRRSTVSWPKWRRVISATDSFLDGGSVGKIFGAMRSLVDQEKSR